MPLLAALLVTSCGDTPVSGDTDASTSVVDSSQVNTNIKFVPEQFDAVGSIQGTVMDKATGEALEDVAVSLLFMPAEADEASVLTDSTGSKGTFAFSGVPVNSEADFDQNNSPYTVEVDASEHDNYRDIRRATVPLTFENTGGDGAATGLVANLTIPLNERAASVKGKLQTNGGTILSDLKVYLYQQFNPIINGGAATQTQMLIDSTMTGSDGDFMFSNVEEDVQIWFEAIDESDPSEVIRYTSPSMNTNSASGDASSTINYGVVQVSTQNETGAFYVAEVTPAPESDIPTDSMFTYSFNRPVADNNYTRTDLGFGNGTFKDDIQFIDFGSKAKAPGAVEFSVSWSSDRTELTITPEGLKDANRYRLDVFNAFNDPDFVDEYGNSLAYNANTTYSNRFEIERLNFSTNDNNAKPHTPTLAADGTEDVDYNSGTVELSWNVDESAADVAKYELWQKKGDDASYELFATVDRDDAEFNEISGSFTVADYGDPLVILRGSSNDVPDEAVTKSVKVRAISENLREGDFSSEMTFSDNIQPDVTAASYNDAAGELQIAFDEPMVKSDVEDPSNYSFEDGGGTSISPNIESIEYTADYGFSTITEVYEVLITIEDPTTLSSGSGETVTVDPSATDLAGNGMDTDDPNNDNDGNENEATY